MKPSKHLESKTPSDTYRICLKSTYARKSASFELAPHHPTTPTPFLSEIFNMHLPQISAPLFSQKERLFGK